MILRRATATDMSTTGRVMVVVFEKHTHLTKV